MAIAVQLIAQFDPTYIWAWHEERDNRLIASLLRDKGVKRISTGWEMQPALEFYRLAGRMPTADPVLRHEADKYPLTGHDGYVMRSPDPSALLQNGLVVLWKNDLTGVTVAVPASH
jgi:hypothetical protein